MTQGDEVSCGAPGAAFAGAGAGAGAARRIGALLLTALLSVSLVLQGCQNMPKMPSLPGSGTASPETPAEQQMKADSSKFTETVLGGAVAACAVGAVVSALTCKLSGSDKTKTCAIAGCVVLGAAGAVDGYVTAKKQQASREKVRETNAIAADVRADNQKMQAFLDSSTKVVAESRARLAQVNADAAAKKISAEDATAERKKIEDNRDLMQKTLDDMKKSRDVYASATKQAEMTGGASRDLDGEITAMNTKIAALERNVRTMNAALSVNRT